MKSKKLGKKLSKKKIIFGIVLLVVVSIVVLRLSSKDKEGLYQEENAKTQDIITYYSFSGNIGAKDSQIVFSKSMMPIKKFYVKEGDLVNKGDILFVLDDSDMASSVDQAAASVELARINYEKAKSTGKEQQLAQVENALASAQLAFDEAKLNLERMTELFNADGISKQSLEQAQKGYDSVALQLALAEDNLNITKQSVEQNIASAKAQLDQAEASYNSVKNQVGDLEVIAEITGEVSEIYIEENDSLITGTKIMDIINYEDLEVIIKVDEFDLNAVSEGKDVTVTINPLKKDVVGKVSKVSKEAQTISGVSFFTAYIDLEKDSDLRVGLSVEVKALNKGVTDATTISLKALQFDNENKPFVYYRDINNDIVKKPVTVGINDGNTVEILEGVKSGEVVLLPTKSNLYPTSFGMMPEQ